MHIAHAALYVHDLEAAKSFFVRYFSAVPGEKYHNPRTGFSSYFLTFGQGARLELMSRTDLVDREKPLAGAGYAHLASARRRLHGPQRPPHHRGRLL